MRKVEIETGRGKQTKIQGGLGDSNFRKEKKRINRIGLY
jgi:hypothetical protein